MTTEQYAGVDPVKVLYDRALQDLNNIKDLERFDRLPDPGFPDERGPNAKECWALFDSLIETYQRALSRFDESVKLDRDIRQAQTQVGELIFRTRAIQRRRPFIEDAKAYLDKSRKLVRYLLEGLQPVAGKRTIKAYLDKVDDCRALWMKYGFDIEEIEAIPGLIDDLRTEFALICKDREPTYKANLPTPTQDDQPKVDTPKKLTKKAGRKPKPWTPLEIEVDELKSQGKTPYEIRDALRGKYPDLTRDQVNAIIESLRKRRGRGNGPK
jgi:hypothetical protein